MYIPGLSGSIKLCFARRWKWWFHTRLASSQCGMGRSKSPSMSLSLRHCHVMPQRRAASFRSMPHPTRYRVGIVYGIIPGVCGIVGASSAIDSTLLPPPPPLLPALAIPFPAGGVVANPLPPPPPLPIPGDRDDWDLFFRRRGDSLASRERSLSPLFIISLRDS